ncbi:MAG: FAD-dependent oxidoreductase [Deltaproteobacteria bacterium]|nr:FAD-dependent oxidoreductase [Deltaproteobacteria bacterium]
MIEVPAAIIGAGPAGLSAAIELARAGVETLVIDENDRPGGQLVKQIHRFFGSRHEMAGMRGFEIGEALFSEAERLGVRFMLNTAAYGIFKESGQLGIHDRRDDLLGLVKAERLILATGARENPLWFPGWTLPGVMGAGAFQTMVNVHRVMPGRRIVVVGSGNVGLIVAFQALQAGIEVAAVCEALPRLGGWEVHGAKLRRQGVPILLSTTVERALGDEEVRGVVLVRLDKDGRPEPGERRVLEVDAICLAVGLSPLAELAWMAGCRCVFSNELGGWLPAHDEWMRTSIETLWVAGDLAGVEEASTAMEEGRLAGLGVSRSLGALDRRAAVLRGRKIRARLEELREGSCGKYRKTAKAALVKGGEPGSHRSSLVPGRTDEPAEDEMVCRCEEVPRALIARAIREGARTVDAVKRRTRAGMGLCQGRTCRGLVSRLITEVSGEPPRNLVPPTVRPPVRPLPMEGLVKGEDLL